MMLRKKWIVLFALVFVAGMMFAACVAPAPSTGGQVPQAGEEETTAQEPVAPQQQEKVFTFGRYQDAVTPDPVMNDSNRDIWYMQQYYSGLLRFTKDMQIEGDLAESWDVSDDGLTYTFHLRPDLKFADGSPITPDDWLWSLNRARNPENGIWWFTLDAVDDMEATEDAVVFHLSEPYVPFIYTPALFNTVVMPKDKVEAAGGWEAFMQSPIGAGPFLMTEWVKGDVMTLEKNPYYWESGKPVVDTIVLKTITDDNARVLALQAGDVDAINFVPPSRVTELDADPNIDVLQFPSTKTTYLTLNDRNAPLDDKRVRQALSMAIDRDALIKTVNFGIGQPATSFRPVGSLYYNDSLEGWPYDPEQAQSLLADAGYADGFDVSIQIIAGNEADLQLATVIKDMWSKIGVNLEIQQLEAGLWTDNYQSNNFEAMINYWTDDIPDPSQETNYAVVYETSQSFHSGFQSDEVDQLAADALKETDPAKRKDMYWRIQEIFNDETPFIPLFHDPLLVGVRSNVKNFTQTPLGTYVWRDLDVE
jgi:peptide/nickel transport system substrate-binding protein